MLSRVSWLVAACIVVWLVAPGSPLAAETPAEMLESKALVDAYNPVLLEYLLEEGSEALPDEQRTTALDQLVTGLKQDIEITPEEQRTAASAAAAAGLAQLLGGSDGRDYGGAAQDATYQVWRGWVDSAFTLRRAGYVDEAKAFFEKCIEVFPYSDLRGRCAIGLAEGNPQEAFQRLLALTEASDIGTINAALRQLGLLVGSEGFPADLRAEAIQRLEVFTGGLKKASHGEAACYGLIATGDPAVVPTLEKLSKGMMNTDFYPCSRRGLLMHFDDRSVVPLLEKQLKGGAFSTTEPHERLFAASLLMEAGEPSGFAFAEEQLTRKQKKGLGKLMSSSSDEVDLRPALVNALVRAGGDRAKQVLKAGLGAAESGSWLETWIAVGLLELGDASGMQLAKRALGNPEWAFTTVRIATALAEHGDLSGIPALEQLYRDAARGVEPDLGKAMLAALAGERSDAASKEARLVRLRQQIAHALEDIDQPGCVPILTTMLGDGEPAVRVAAAYSLSRMSTAQAAAALETALRTDFGASNGRSRNPTVHAHVVRAAAARFPDEEATSAVLEAGSASDFASVRFLALCEAEERSSEEADAAATATEEPGA